MVMMSMMREGKDGRTLGRRGRHRNNSKLGRHGQLHLAEASRDETRRDGTSPSRALAF